LEFVDDGEKVMKRSDGRRSGSVGIAGEPSRRSQNECRADDVERNGAAVEFKS
jgi:hypothetical protein